LTWQLRGLSSSLGLWPPFGPAAQILLLTAGFTAVGLVVFVVWRVTGNDAWIEGFFQVPGAILLVWLAAMGLLFNVRVCRRFFPGEPMRGAWRLIAP
jgi:hypothetical protein